MPREGRPWWQGCLNGIWRHREKAVCDYDTPRDLIVLYKNVQTVLSKPLKSLYGVSEAGYQMANVIERWFLEFVFVRVMRMHQLYIRYPNNCKIDLILAEVTNDMQVAWSMEEMMKARDALHDRFRLVKSIDQKHITYNGCKIYWTKKCYIKMSLYEYTTNVSYVDVSRSRW